MLSVILRVLGYIFVAWLFRRLFLIISGASKNARTKSSSAGASKHMVKDPVCGMYMDSRLAIRLESRREEFYFCSQECKNKYLSKSDEAQSGTAASAG